MPETQGLNGSDDMVWYSCPLPGFALKNAKLQNSIPSMQLEGKKIKDPHLVLELEDTYDHLA